MGNYADWAIEDELDDIIVTEPKKEKKELPTKRNAANGVYKWLRDIPLTGAGKNTAYSTREDRIISRYGIEILYSEQKPRVLASIISKEHWRAFTKWVKDNYTIKRYKQ